MLSLRKIIVSKQLWFQRSQTRQISWSFGKKKKPKEEEIELSVQERFRFATMYDMPVPKGDWSEHNAKRNQKYNAVLVLGVISLVGSIICLKETMFFNAVPPPFRGWELLVLQCCLFLFSSLWTRFFLVNLLRFLRVASFLKAPVDYST